MLEDLAQTLLRANKHTEGEAPLHQHLKSISSKMDVHSALKSVGKMALPKDIQALAHKRSEHGSGTGLSEESMAKARGHFSDMVDS